MENNKLKEVTGAMDRLIRHAKDRSMAPHEERKMRLYSTKDVCTLIGKSTTSLYNAEALGVIEKPEINENGRRIGYTLEDVNKLRKHFAIKPREKRKFDKDYLGVSLAVYNFKGGVGKTTTSVCFAQYLAISGYKVLVIDMDSQGSTTSLFGYIPDEDITEDDTVLPFTLYGEKSSLSYAIRKTHVDGLFLIPANQDLSSSEFQAASQISEGSAESAIEYFHRLNEGIDSIREQFDFIIVDAPPSLGIVGIQTLISVDNIVVPCPPRMLDFVSTRQFLQTATVYVAKVAKQKSFNNIKIMGSMYDKKNEKAKEFMEIMEEVLGGYMYKNKMLHSQAIDNSSVLFQTPWEAEKLDKRIINNMKDLFNEIVFDLTKGDHNVDEEI